MVYGMLCNNGRVREKSQVFWSRQWITIDCANNGGALELNKCKGAFGTLRCMKTPPRICSRSTLDFYNYDRCHSPYGLIGVLN